MEMGKISFQKLILIDDFKTYILLFQMYSWKMLLVALAFIGCASAFNVAKVEPKVRFYDEDQCWIVMMWLDVTMSVNISVTADMWTGLVARFMTLDGEFDKSFRHGAKMCDD